MHPHTPFLLKNNFLLGSVEKGHIQNGVTVVVGVGAGVHVYEGLVQTKLPHLSYLSPS